MSKKIWKSKKNNFEELAKSTFDVGKNSNERSKSAFYIKKQDYKMSKSV